MPMQINGKLRGTIDIAVRDIENKEMIESEAKKSEKVLVFLQGHSVKKFVYIPGKVANFVV